MATDVEPRYADGWKRRGQARSALGETEGALQDLQKAADLMPLWGGGTVRSASCLFGSLRGIESRLEFAHCLSSLWS